jgi:SAM-dependent methyltransferase
MSEPTHPLRDIQYGNSANLAVRMRLHDQFGDAAVRWPNWVFDHLLELRPQASILEVGCGPGRLWRENAGRIPSGWNLTLSDYSPGMIAEARAAFPRSGTHFELCDAEDLPFGNAAFDAVIANHMLYHVPGRARALAGFARVLAPGGVLFAATNGESHMAEGSSLLRRFGALDGSLGFGTPVHRGGGFTLESGEDELKPHFAAVSLRHFHNQLTVPDAAALAAYLLSDRTQVTDAMRDRLTAFIQTEISQNGPIRITTSSGLFVAR